MVAIYTDVLQCSFQTTLPFHDLLKQGTSLALNYTQLVQEPSADLESTLQLSSGILKEAGKWLPLVCIG